MTYNIEIADIDLDLTPLRNFLEEVSERLQSGSNTVDAVRTGGNYIVNEWIKTAEGKFKHSQGGYARGIMEGVYYPFNGNNLHYRTEHTQKYAIYLERGYDSFDMHKFLLTSEKVRISKQGNRYLIIPFRHGTPGSKGISSMPKEIYSQARDLTSSKIIGRINEGVQTKAKTFEDSQIFKQFNSKKVLRNVYNWGGRLNNPELPDKYKGLVRFEKNPNNVRNEISMGKFINSTDSEQQYSTYFTFRVMSDNPSLENLHSSWIHPGLKPMRILGETVDKCYGNVKQMLLDGIIKDMKEMGFN